jgi:hypothetical protein
MRLARTTALVVMTVTLEMAYFGANAQEATVRPLAANGVIKTQNIPQKRPSDSAVRHRQPRRTTVMPPVTILHNPEYLSGEASINVAANSNPLIRIGIAQNGVTLIEFPSADRFFAVHAGNSDLVTVEKSPSLRRDHHLILRAGSGFLVPPIGATGSQAILPATSIIAQMDSGMAITMMVYPVPLLKQQAHRLVIKYNPDEVIVARKTAGLATNLTGPDIEAQPVAAVDPPKEPFVESNETSQEVEQKKPPPSDYRADVEEAVKLATENPKWFKTWAQQRHGLRISTLPPRDLSDTVRLVVFAVRNAGSDSLRLLEGYPDLYVETLNEKGRPVEAGTKVEKFSLASSGTTNLLAPGEMRFFALAYKAPILGAQQHLKIVAAHMSAADEPAMADLTAVAR